MGMTRKLASLSSAGLISYRSKGERIAAAAQTQARASKRSSKATAKREKAEIALLEEQLRQLKGK